MVQEIFTEPGWTGSSAARSDCRILFEEFNRLVGLPEIRENEMQVRVSAVAISF